ncbi:MAG: tetratricopeptide repeat protein [Deltaproteobacteria bacterium]|nr:tetratricopeptide repeat protein [Deltaproteobacteria bacterium]
MKIFSFLKKKGTGEKTLEEYLKIAKEEPDNTGIHMKIADLYLKSGDKKMAIEEYTYAAKAYAHEELYQLAMSIYKTILSIDPGLVNVYLTLAELYQKQGFAGDAAATYERLAGHYIKEGKVEEVKNIVEKMLVLDHSNQFIQKKAERLLAQTRGEAGEEKEIYEQGAIPRDRARRGEGIKIASPEEIIDDQGFFDLGAQLEDEGELSISETAKVSEDEGVLEVDRVFEGIRKNIEEKPGEESCRLHYELGIAYQQMEKIDEAIEELKLALGDQEIKNDCFIRLCSCFREKEMYKHALNAVQSGLKSRFISQGEFLGLNYEMGLTYAEMGDSKKAIAAFNEVAKVNPDYKETKRILEELKGQR